MKPYRTPTFVPQAAPANDTEPMFCSADSGVGFAFVLIMGVCAALGLACALSGCAALSKAEQAAKSGSQAMQAAEPILLASYQASQEACVQLPYPDNEECVRQVRAEYEPIISAIKVFRADWCALAVATGEPECK